MPPALSVFEAPQSYSPTSQQVGPRGTECPVSSVCVPRSTCSASSHSWPHCPQHQSKTQRGQVQTGGRPHE
eukprot:13841083-Alexandrium_andersonii.AAC.1